MKLLVAILLIGIFTGFHSFASAQLSGYYTIGGAAANYVTLSDAMNDLYAQGINGNVIFALNAGIYPGIVFTDIPGASAGAFFQLQAASLDSSDVTISGTLSFQEAEFITVDKLTISSGNLRAINFNKSKSIHIRNCAINSNFNSNFLEAPITIRHYLTSSVSYSDITIVRCTINSQGTSIIGYGVNGATTISNCEVNTGVGPSIIITSARRTNLRHNTINGGVEIETNQQSTFKENIVIGEVNIGFLDSVLYNTFYSNEEYKISSLYYRGNYFYEQNVGYAGWGTSANVKFIDNYFEKKVDLSFATDITMESNVFLDEVSLGFNEQLLFINNKVYGGLYYGNASTSFWNYRLYNNIFFNDIVIARGHHSIIKYNSFLDGAILWVEYGDIQVYDNNFCSGIIGYPAPENINHNNYYPLIYNYYDTNSLHFDPEYDENEPGKATNPLLQGKGWSQGPPADHFGNQRKNPPAIGANEVMICSGSMNNEIAVPCGEEVYLNLCNTPNAGEFWWTPDSCIQAPNNAYAVVTAYENTTLYLYNSMYGLVDSIFIQTLPFQVEIAAIPLIYCGYGRTLNATYHPNANYHWTPEYGLSDPNIRTPLLNPIDTINLQYVLEGAVEGCGTSYDTIVVDYDPLPNIAMYYLQQNDTVFFVNASRCADEYFWEFGDGTTSTEENPAHIYLSPGIYTITLTGINEYGSRGSTANFAFFWVGTDELMLEKKIHIYPNPADENLVVKGLPDLGEAIIQMINISGNVLLDMKCYSKEAVIDLNKFANGIYFLQIKKGTFFYTERIIVVH
jgi:hypothetical protein